MSEQLQLGDDQQEKPIHIVELRAENVKRLRAVTIRPDGALVVLGGKNGAGKSSVLDAIMYALGGKSTLPAEPIRKGQRRARIELDLEGGLHVTRTFDASGGGSQLVITNDDGDKLSSPQTLLDKLCGRIAFDPLEYSRMKPDEQARLLRELVGLDTSELDSRRKFEFDARTERNRDAKQLEARLKALPLHEGVPTEEIDVAEIVAEITKMTETATANAAQRRKAADAEASANARSREVDQLVVAIRDLEAQLERKRAEHVKAKEVAVAAASEAAKLKTAADALVDPDPAAAQRRVAEAQETNKRVRGNKERAKVARELSEALRAAERLTDAIADIDQQKTDQLAAAKFPVPGLGFDNDGTVTLDGVPFDQASQAQRIRVSVAMGLALNPKLRVLLVRDGSLLDREALAAMAEMAEQADAQVWVERVSETGEGCSVVIEDGAVQTARAAE